MRGFLLLLMSAWLVQAQPLPQGKAIKGIEFDSKGLIEALNPTVHIHTLMHGSCKGEPDHVYGDSKGVYFACISEQDICTEVKFHKGAGVPRALITQYEQVKKIQEAERSEYERKEKERQEQRVRDGLSTGDPALDAAQSRQRLEAIANEVRTARAQGRQPNLGQFTSAPGATPAAPAQPAPAPTVLAPTIKRATTTLLADEKLNGIATGATLSDVLQKLGNPYLRISGSADKLTYRLESGGAAELYFEGGVLARKEILPAR